MDGARPGEIAEAVELGHAVAGVTAQQQERIAVRTEQVRGWLAKSPAKDNEDRVFRLLGLKAADAPASQIAAAAKELLGKQRDDGGWSFGAYAGKGAVAKLASLSIELPLSQAYAGVEFPPESEPEMPAPV